MFNHEELELYNAAIWGPPKEEPKETGRPMETPGPQTNQGDTEVYSNKTGDTKGTTRTKVVRKHDNTHTENSSQKTLAERWQDKAMRLANTIATLILDKIEGNEEHVAHSDAQEYVTITRETLGELGAKFEVVKHHEAPIHACIITVVWPLEEPHIIVQFGTDELTTEMVALKLALLKIRAMLIAISKPTEQKT